MKLLLLLALLLAGPARLRQVKEAEVKFQIDNAGFTVNGTLSGLEATVRFDPTYLADAHIRRPINAKKIILIPPGLEPGTLSVAFLRMLSSCHNQLDHRTLGFVLAFGSHISQYHHRICSR